MALIGVLITAIIIIILMVIYNPFFSKTENANPLEPKKIENSANEAIDKATDNKKLENEQIKNIDAP